MKYMFGVKLDDIKVNGKPLNICKAINGTCLITFDSGTTMSSVPKAAANVLVAQGVPTTNHVVECGGEQEIGSLTYVIGGKDYTLDSNEWLFPKQNLTLAQGTKFKMGLGPELLLEAKEPVEGGQVTLATKKQNPTDEEEKSKMVCSSVLMTMELKH